MKQFPLALIGLLCATSAWTAQEIEQQKQFSRKNISTQIDSNPDSIRISDAQAEQLAQAVDEQKEKKSSKPAVRNGTVFREMVVTGGAEQDTHFTSPSMRVTRTQIEQHNAQTTEEVLKYMPSVQIRQRFVGDPNGVMSIRGSDMLLTPRNMVFADGMPLHNLLEVVWFAAPRWSMVGPNEVDSIDVVYGPFSAEYSGNAMGGVANIKTRMPHKQEFHLEGSLFIQPYKTYGPDKGTFIGDRQYFSYGNRIQDKFTVFLAYNRLEAQSQPQMYFIDNTGLFDVPGGTPVNGGIRTSDLRGTPSIIYGDIGPEKVNTHLFKGKFGYDITSNLQTLFTVAYEERTRNQNHPKNYLRTANGDHFWGGSSPVCNSVATCANPGNASLDGTRFDVVRSGFGDSRDKRETLNLGLSLRGTLTPGWDIDTVLSYFDVLKDIRATAFFNHADPGNTGAGQLQDFHKYNWWNYDLKLSTPMLLGYDKLSFLAGYHFDQYNLGFRQYALTDYANLTRGALQDNLSNNGRTSTHAAFAQSRFRFMPNWDITAGLRQEWWEASRGMVSGVVVPDRSETATSPKVSLGYEPGQWKFRYSFGRAHRFPVVSELYQSLGSPTSILTANAMLKPENGVHHNFMMEYGLPKGYVRVNVFRDDVKNAIRQITSASGALTSYAFQNIGEVGTTGVELIFEQRNILGSRFDFMFNGTWMDSKIDDGPIVRFTESTGVPANFSLTGKQVIRLPHWQANFFSTYHVTDAWDVSLSGRYVSDSYNSLDNKDYKNNVYGTQSDFFFMDFKTSYRYRFNNGLRSRFSFGISNLNNDKAWVFHPYPQRTYLLEAAFSY